ncbi:glycosyltransferase [Porifericola rhodea]|uniref:glycosyltransferase n=1 Tax=Porifericola rhodea TaxID=930972 RepID=UPI002665B0CC|nr:glycosyltransferase [Porifericola rhodea]WKN32530.1 glycosyltransferase [Porifericola rhodea]
MAPIVLFVFKRLDHTLKVIEALKNCMEANDSILYIYSDAARTPEEKPVVEKLRSSLREIDGFKKVYLIERECNRGLAYNIIHGVSEVIKEEGKVIVLEDDIICSPYFLRYMNDCLDKYKECKDIFSISAYHPIVKNHKGTNIEVYKNPRNSSWGWGTWKDRWEKVDWEVLDFKNFIGNKRKRKEFNIGGEDLSWMLWKQMKGKLDSWSIRFTYAQYKNKAYTIYPVQSLVSNIGFDGSGSHSDVTDKYAVNLNVDSKKVSLPNKPEVCETLLSEFKTYYDLTFKKKLKKVILMDLLDGWNR